MMCTHTLPRHLPLLLFVALLVCCSESGPQVAPLGPSPVSQVARPPAASSALHIFTESSSGFSTSELRDVHEQIVQFNTVNELIWQVDGSRLPGYRVESHNFFGRGATYFIGGRLCAEGCALEVRFGTKDGERRAYLTADYGP